MNGGRGACRHDQPAAWRLHEGRDIALDLAVVAHVDRHHVHPQRWCRRLYRAELTDPGRYRGVTQNRRALQAGAELREQLQPFGADAVLELNESGGVPAWTSQAADETGADRIDDMNEHDG